MPKPVIPEGSARHERPSKPIFLNLAEWSAIAAASASRAFTELLAAFNRKLEICGDRVCIHWVSPSEGLRAKRADREGWQMNAVDVGAWNANWAWSLPLIVLNVVIHVIGLGLINESVVRVLSGALPHRRFMPTFAVGMGAAVLLATALHGIEAATWATAYRLLGALPDTKSAILYSLSALTSYGHANLFLEEQWQLMGALEALNGMLLFGLTTAFLFAIIQKVWPLGSRGWHRNA